MASAPEQGPSSPEITETDPEPIPSSSGASTSGTSRSAGESLSQFFLSFDLDEYQPTIPDPVVSYLMHSAGFQSKDPRIVRLVSIAAQKFMSDIANDALQHCKMKSAGSSKKASKDKRFVLTMEDLTPALAEYGINIKKPHYFT